MTDATASPVPEIDVEAFAATVTGDPTAAVGARDVVLDVREPSEQATGHVPGAVLVPSGEVRNRLYEIPKQGRLFVVCATGARSRALVPFLRAVGYDAVSVAGGMCAWSGTGLPTEVPRA